MYYYIIYYNIYNTILLYAGYLYIIIGYICNVLLYNAVSYNQL